MTADSSMREMVAGLDVPDFETTAFTTPPALVDATVSIVTTAGLAHRGDPLWDEGTSGFRSFAADDRDLIIAHQSTNFDRSGFTADRNVAYPIDRLEEMEHRGAIGAVAPRHLSFTGPILELTTIRLDTGPAAARLLLDDRVDVVLLTPV